MGSQLPESAALPRWSRLGRWTHVPILVWVTGCCRLVKNIWVFAERLKSVLAFTVALLKLDRVVWRDCLPDFRYQPTVFSLNHFGYQFLIGIFVHCFHVWHYTLV